MAAKWIARVACVALVGGLLADGMVLPVVADAPANQAGGAAAAPEEVFKAKGLTKAGYFLVTEDEAKVHDAAREVRGLKTKVVSEALERANIARAIDTSTTILTQYETRLASLDAQLNKLKNNPDQYNQLVGPYNQTLKQAKDRAQTLEALQKRSALVEDSQSEYSDAALAAAKLADAAAVDYAQLAQDAHLKAAIDSYNQTAAVAVKLGPSGTCISDTTYVKKSADDIIAQGIPVRMDGNVPTVQVIINGKKVDMIWDSGASFVSLSAQTAADLGIKATADDPTLETTIANGQKVQSKLVTVPAIQLGPFTVQNVQCLVDPPGGERSPDLLGGSFQNHFLCKLDAQASILRLTPSDKSATIGAPSAVASVPGNAGAPSAGGKRGGGEAPADKGPGTVFDVPGGDAAGAPLFPGAGPGRSLMATMKGKYISYTDGIYTIGGGGDRITSTQKFVPPVGFRIVAKTDSTNLRFAYAANQIIFNWEQDMNQLRIDGGPANGHNKKGAGKIPIDTFVTIDLLVLPGSMTIQVDGKERFSMKADFSTVNQALSIFQGASSTVQVKSIEVVERK